MSIFILLRMIYFGCLALMCVIAFRRGGRSERTGARIVLIASLSTIVVGHPSLFEWRTARAGLVIVDILVLFAFLDLALRSRRFWPLWVTAFHLIAVCSHLLVAPRTHQLLQAYALLQGFWAYPIMVSIMLASMRRDARLATFRDRRPNSSPSNGR